MVAYGCIVSCFRDYFCVIMGGIYVCMHGDCIYFACVAGDQRSVGLWPRNGVSVALGVSPLLRGRDADTVAVTAA